MQIARPVGREAASRKYDILSALMAFGLAQDKTTQVQVMRLMSLITTRYNWQRDELSMGQEDIARLWCVETRTVKREMAKLRGRGWLVLKRQGARGRVSLYGMDLDKMLDDTRPVWENIGPDFGARMLPVDGGAPQTNVVPLRPVPAPMPVASGPESPSSTAGALWAAAQATLHTSDPATYGAWFHGLREIEMREGRLILAAPTRFHQTYVETHLMERLVNAVRRADPTVEAVRLEI